MAQKLYAVVGAPVAVGGELRSRHSEFVANDRDPMVQALVRSGHLKLMGAAPGQQSEVFVPEDDGTEE